MKYATTYIFTIFFNSYFHPINKFVDRNYSLQLISLITELVQWYLKLPFLWKAESNLASAFEAITALCCPVTGSINATQKCFLSFYLLYFWLLLFLGNDSSRMRWKVFPDQNVTTPPPPHIDQKNWFKHHTILYPAVHQNFLPAAACLSAKE